MRHIANHLWMASSCYCNATSVLEIKEVLDGLSSKHRPKVISSYLINIFKPSYIALRKYM